MAQYAYHFFPGLHFLATQFGRQLPQQDQFMRAAIQAERATCQMVNLFAVAFADREQAVAAALKRFLQWHRQYRQQRVDRIAFQFAAFVQQAPRRDIRINDRTGIHAQEHRDRRVLHHGIEQQFALHQVQALIAQRIAEIVVRLDQFADFIIAFPAYRKTVVAVAIAADGAGQRAKQGKITSQLAVQKNHGNGRHHGNNEQSHEPVGFEFVSQQQAQGRRNHQ